MLVEIRLLSGEPVTTVRSTPVTRGGGIATRPDGIGIVKFNYLPVVHIRAKCSLIRKSHPVFKGADLGYFHDNRAGRMSLSEFVDKPNPLFARYDKKGTCRVTLDDIAAVLEKSGSGRGRC
jgi:hypothetical protein